MKIEFVNHASYIIDYNGVRLICDPWTEGTSFDHGWSLLAKSKFTFDDYKNITHIWFSHEHPDHFSPPNLSKIPEDYRKNITVLYQYTNDKKVINWCRQKGFKEVIELQPSTMFKLAEGFEIMNNPFLYGDSWSFAKVGKWNIFNANDCLISNEEQAQEIQAIIKEQVDILFTQFSYARFYGNANEPEYRRKAAQERLGDCRAQISVFKPKYVVPFASYVWFGHEESYFMNDEITTADKIYDWMKDMGVIPVMMYPGDVTDFEHEHDSQSAIDRYMADYDRVRNNPPALRKSSPVAIEELVKNSEQLNKRVADKYGRLYFKVYRKIKPVQIYLTDLDVTVEYSFLNRMKVVKKGKGRYDVSMSSESLNFGFKFDFGFGTVIIGARLQKASDEGLARFETYSHYTDAINQNLEFTAPNYYKIAFDKVLWFNRRAFNKAMRVMHLK